MLTWRVLTTDVLAGLREIASDSVQAVCTSPPYWAQRDYRTVGQIGLEMGASFVGNEINPKTAAAARRRLAEVNPLFAREAK